ncbi:Sap, sulfolipid-1-addressing protein [Amycolatopsis xylanica]|uniref:Sap, sulfolipid-1-addressing protein n=1 Tax=Amycolatopsis xylanica TaxID=589385 RepID=A0A1H2VY88_9PSEU|nr:GAP family protein [Amycolatopsis xylanica]SDW73263.1 Sap, sulfolipid-1-addressing protein [Amycolatopsis xylanica]
MTNLAVLPLAVTMMAGPQLMSALLFITAKRPVAVSLSFLAGVTVAVYTGVTLTAWLATRFVVGGGHGGGPAKGIEFVLVALLLGVAGYNWINRKTIEPPNWLGSLMTAGPGKAFTTGLLLIGLFPSDVLVMLTVGAELARTGEPVAAAWPFIAATVLIAALPLLAYLLFRRKAERAMPRVRDWLTGHSWLVTIIVALLFVVLILG